MTAARNGMRLNGKQRHACSQNHKHREVPERTNYFSSHFFSFRSQFNATSLPYELSSN